MSSIECEPLLSVDEFDNAVLLRLPDAERSEAEAALCHAHAVAHENARAFVSENLPGLDIATLVSAPDDLEPARGRLTPDLFARLDLAGAVARVLETSDVVYPKLSMASIDSDHHPPPPPPIVAEPHGRFDHHHARLGPLIWSLGDGQTAVLHAIHQHAGSVAELTEQLGLLLHTQVGANAYLSAGGEGFGSHWDEHDVLVVQAAGQKTWRIFEPSVPAALTGVTDPGVGERVAWDGTLDEGDALLVPRGWGHSVSSPEGVLSLHVSFPLQRLRGLDLSGFVAGLAGYWPLFRADVPFDAHRPFTSYDGSLYDTPKRFAGAVGDLVAEASFEQAVAQWRAKLPPRPRGTMAATLSAFDAGQWERVVVRGSFPGGVSLAAIGEPDVDSVLIAALGRFFHLAEHSVFALADLVRGEPIACGDLSNSCPNGDERCSERLAFALVAHGLIDVIGW